MKKSKTFQQGVFSPLGFTLIEIMVGILIFAIVIIGGFKAYNGVLIGKIKLIESVNIQKQAFFFSEKFFEEIKKGGTIDYEEYFNRKVVGTQTGSGHYKKNTGFGNFGIVTNGFYYCRSKIGSGNKMTGTGCVGDFSAKIDGTDIDVGNSKQRYGQYSFQFIDYNANYNDDFGDEDGVNGIIGDDDDEYLGFGPTAFSGSEVKEIYLISADKKKRTYFRWNIKDDPDNPATCNFVTGSGGCLSTIEFLKLDGKDWGFDHDISTNPTTGQYDGVVDTWIIDPDFTGGATIVAGSASDTGFWQPLFGDNVNVESAKFFIYPNKDRELAWQDSDPKININPYIRLQLTLSPSYKAKRGFKGKIPKIKINTTINLTDIYSR